MKHILTGGLLLAALIATPAFARMGMYGDECDGPGGKGPGKGSKMERHHGPMGGHMLFGDVERMQERLGLSDEQVKQISAINMKFRKEHLAIDEKMEPKRLEMRTVLRADVVDLKKAEALLRETSEFHVQKQLLMIRHRIEIEQVLTPEQKKKARTERPEDDDPKEKGIRG
jgi:Spy/CpxP family protein refolding chaperone